MGFFSNLFGKKAANIPADDVAELSVEDRHKVQFKHDTLCRWIENPASRDWKIADFAVEISDFMRLLKDRPVLAFAYGMDLENRMMQQSEKEGGTYVPPDIALRAASQATSTGTVSRMGLSRPYLSALAVAEARREKIDAGNGPKQGPFVPTLVQS